LEGKEIQTERGEGKEREKRKEGERHEKREM